MHHFLAIGEFKLELQSGNAQFGSNFTTLLAVWLRNLTDDLENQMSTFFKQHQAFCIILSPCVNSNWSYGQETAKWGHDLCDLHLWPWPFAWTSHRSMVINAENLGIIRRQEHCQKSVTDGRTNRWTKNVLRAAAWSQLKMPRKKVIRNPLICQLFLRYL